MAHAAPSADPATPGDGAELVRRAQQPAVVIDLESFDIVASSPAAAELLGCDGPLDGMPLERFVARPEHARRGLDDVRNGVVDSYQVSSGVRRADGTILDGTVCVRAIETTVPRSTAVVTFTERGVPRVGSDDASATLGTVAADERISSITTDVRELLGLDPAECIGKRLAALVHPDDLDVLARTVEAAVRADGNAGNELRIRAGDGSWRRVYLMITAASTSPLGFAATRSTVRAPAGEIRVAELEGHLARIAREIEAAGFLRDSTPELDAERLPELAQLNATQGDILVRLLRGERVPSIARALYLSPNTIRNYLSAMYRTFGVHSQAELIEKVRSLSPDA